MEDYLKGLTWTMITTTPCHIKSKLLNLSKLKAFTAYNINVAQVMKFLSNGVVNILRKGENAGYQHFFLTPRCFQQASSVGFLNVEIMW